MHRGSQSWDARAAAQQYHLYGHVSMVPTPDRASSLLEFVSVISIAEAVASLRLRAHAHRSDMYIFQRRVDVMHVICVRACVVHYVIN
jgi:hypothetical protein